MSMFIELFSEDVDFHGDSESTVAKINLTGWPFNMDLTAAATYKLAASIVGMDETTGEETTEQIGCAQEPGNFVVITFPEPIPGGETRTVRLRAKVFV